MDRKEQWHEVYHLNSILEEALSSQDHFGADRITVDLAPLDENAIAEATHTIAIFESFKFTYNVSYN
jgi:hypothetical protein